MTEEQFQTALAHLRADWGRLEVDGGYVRSTKDPTTGMLVGMRAPLIAEIVNRAMDAKS